MTNKMLKCLWGIASTALIALYLFFLYQLLLVPAILDWSAFGVLLSLALTGLLIYSIPAARRRSTTVLGITFLLAVKAINNIGEYPSVRYSLGIVFIFLVLLTVGKLLGHFTLRRYLIIFSVALILTTSFDLSMTPFLTEFKVKWESPLLYKRMATIDYFPVKLVDVDGDNIKEIVTQENLEQAAQEQTDIAETGKKYQILQPENNHFAVYKWDGRTFKELPPSKYSLHKLESVLPTDYPSYPFYTIPESVNSEKGLEQQMNPQLDRHALIEQATRFASFPFELLALGQKTLETSLNNQRVLGQPVPSSVMAVGRLWPDNKPETVAIDTNLKVREGERVVAVLNRDTVPDIGTSEVFLGDVNRDNIDELMLTAETARILKLSSDGSWQTLWSSPEPINEKTRFQKFRFEDFAALGNNPTPQLIALSKSNVRENTTRYMTGYEYKNGVLEQKWRVFTGLINLRAGDVDGDGQNELIGYMYRGQRIFVLEKHSIPVVPTLYTLTGGLILLGFGLQWRQKRQNTGGGERNA